MATRSPTVTYMLDTKPGITRRRAGSGFVYISARGQRITDARALARIRALAVPPAWTHVWISASPDSHLQATGRDAMGRKQYRYHAHFRARRERSKFDRLLEIARVLPGLRRKLKARLKAPGLPREKVLATIISLIDETGMRIGNECYRQLHASHGLTTLRDRHLTLRGSRVTIDCPGKSGQRTRVTLEHEQLARILGHCRDVPGAVLFQFLDDDGGRHPIYSGHVNDFLRELAGAEMTAKDLRTWHGTVIAARFLYGCAAAESKREREKNLRAAFKEVAAALCNTPATTRKHYIHPGVTQAYLDGKYARLAVSGGGPREPWIDQLDEDERLLMRILQPRGARERHAA